jgi:hypothetical protein
MELEMRCACSKGSTHLLHLRPFRTMRCCKLILSRGSWKTGILEPEKTLFARERPINTFPLQRTRDTTKKKVFENVFSTGSMPRPTRVEAGSNTSTLGVRVVGGDEKGTQYPEYSLANVYRGGYKYGTWPSRLAGLECNTLKCDYESRGSRAQGWLRWRGPAAIVNERPSSRQRGCYIRTGKKVFI